MIVVPYTLECVLVDARITIEPRILDLHETKRELAEDLLPGMEKSKRLDLDEVRDLLSAGA